MVVSFRAKALVQSSPKALAINTFLASPIENLLMPYAKLFKYTDFIIQTINDISNANIKLLNIALPIGISFYTFQIISYIIDVYNGKVKVQKNIIKLATI